MRETYSGLIHRHLGRAPRKADGVPAAAVTRREKELGLQIPDSLRRWYLKAGKIAELNQRHNRLYEPHDLVVEGGYLVFMEENQAVVHWGFRLSDLDQDDPEVWQRVNSKPPEWYSEELPFSKFLAKMLDWQAGLENESPT